MTFSIYAARPYPTPQHSMKNYPRVCAPLVFVHFPLSIGGITECYSGYARTDSMRLLFSCTLKSKHGLHTDRTLNLHTKIEIRPS